MAGSRHYWWENILKGVNPANWLGKPARKAAKRRLPKTERRRGSREFGQKKTSPRRRVPPGSPQPEERETRRGDPLRDIWNDEGAGRGYRRARELFDSMPAMYEDELDREETWQSFVENMLGSGPFKANDPNNPFWSQIGLSPARGGGFDWQAWRAVMDRRGSP
jgi:hypothetical protein